MSGLPSGVQVLRHVPQHLVDKFMSGELKLWGGVLRQAGGPGRGQIAGFLTEGWELVRQVEQHLSITAEALQGAVGSAKMASQLAAGMGVLNLGVQVAGFAVVVHRLNQISGQIEAVHRDLRAIGQNVEWLVMAEIADMRAEAESAVVSAGRAIRQGDRVPLMMARAAVDKAGRKVLYLSEEMARSGRAVSQRALFEQFVNLGAVLVHADALCAQALDGADEAARAVSGPAAGLRRLSDGYRDQVRNFQANPLELLRIGDAGRVEVKALGQRLEGVVGRLESHVPQFDIQHALGIDAAGWRALVAPEGSGVLTCITMEEGTNGDFLELIKRSARI